MSWLDYLAPIGEAIGGIGSTLIQDNTRGDYYDILRKQRQSEYDTGKAEYDRYGQYLSQVEAAKAANRAASSANARARAGAASATEKNRQKAAKKALEITKQYLGQRMDMFKPYMESAGRLLPQKEQSYTTGLNNLNMMSAYLNRPEQQAKLNQSIPATNINLKLPNYFSGGK